MNYSSNRYLHRLALFFIDTICSVISFYLAGWIRYQSPGEMNTSTNYRETIAFLILISLAIHLFSNRDNGFMKRSWMREIPVVISYVSLQTGLLIIIVFMIHMTSYLSRLHTGYFYLLSLVSVYIIRLAARAVIYRFYSSASTRKNVLMILQPSNLSDVLNHFNAGTTFHVCGVLEVQGEEVTGTVDHQYFHSTLERLTRDLVPFSFDEVFISLPNDSSLELERTIKLFEDMGVACHYSMPLPDIAGNRSHLEIYGDYPVVTYTYHTISTGSLFIKRVIDIIGSIVGLAITGVLFLFLAPAIKLDSKGPVIYASTRIGRNGRRFKFYKFRSMVQDAESQKAELLKQNEVTTSLMFKVKDDPRITRVGKFIRKTSLDEFPQFWNVFKGDMSLVGTRPPTVDEYEQYNEHYRRRLSMKPGITGLWQVSGRSEIKDFDDVVKLDLQYIDNWSFGLDFKILLQTVAVVFKHKGAE